MSYIEFKNVCKEYEMGEIKIKALQSQSVVERLTILEHILIKKEQKLNMVSLF